MERVTAAVRNEATKRGASLQDVANILKIHKSQVSRRMNGEIAFSLTELQALAITWQLPLSTFVKDVA